MNPPKILVAVLLALMLLLATLACTTPQSQSAEVPVTAPTAKAIVPPPTDTTEPRAVPLPTDTTGPPTPTSVQPPAATAVPPTNTLEPTNAPLATSTPEAKPTPTNTPSPTFTPHPAPTPTDTSPTTFTPRPKPTPIPRSPLHGLARAFRLQSQFANQLESLPWIADGIDDRERETAQMLVDAANHYPDTFKALLKKPWVTDHDLTDAEATAIYGIRWMARRDEASTLAILQMPFLQTLEFDDSLALLALHRLARYADDGRFETLLEHPELADGITDDLTTMVTAVGTIREADEVERMLNPGYANIEVHVGQTTLTPELKISIVRTHSDGSPETMPELVRIAELLESTMQVPLPKPHLIFVISDQATSVPGSQGTRYDFAYGLRGDRENLQRFARQYATDRPMLPSVVIHEIGHDYYGSEIKSWLNHTPIKAGFEYIYRMDGRDRSDVPANVLNVIQRRDCTARNIQHLEEMNPSSSDRGNRLCHHYLGYWMGRELLEAVGQDEFMARMRRLYHLKNKMVAEGADPGIAEVRELFPDQLEIVERYWSGDVGNPEERYWDGLASLTGHPMEHTLGCSCAGCMGTL